MHANRSADIFACRRFDIRFTAEPGVGRGVMTVSLLASSLPALSCCQDCKGFALSVIYGWNMRAYLDKQHQAQ